MTFWLDKRVWVTGGTGFLGRVVVEKIRERGCQNILATGIDQGDLVEPTVIARYLQFKPDLVIHLAAIVGGIGEHIAKPAEYFYQNLLMGIQLMHACWKSGVEKFVAIGTVCSYPKITPIPFKEENLWNGYPDDAEAPYSLAKKMLLVQSQAYRQQYGWNSIYLMPVNLYGPGDNFNPKSCHVIPALIKKISDAKLNGENYVTVWGDGSATREFLFVEDAAEGILLAAERYNKPEPVNLGSGVEISIHELVLTVARLLKYNGEIRWDATKPKGQPRRCLDVTRAEKEFSFRARMEFGRGLKQTINWYCNT